jgi:hypothetical protein
MTGNNENVQNIFAFSPLERMALYGCAIHHPVAFGRSMRREVKDPFAA